jgi:sulfur-oxidizing protein SoxY
VENKKGVTETMITTYPKGISRRGWLRWTVILSAAAAIPGRVWAAVARPEAAFGATALDEALAALGDTPQVHEGIQFMTPDIAENGAVVPIRLQVDAEALPNVSKVSVLVEMNPNPLAASFDIPPGTEVYIETRVKVAQTCTLYAVVEADGQLYMQSRETKVTLGGCGG